MELTMARQILKEYNKQKDFEYISDLSALEEIFVLIEALNCINNELKHREHTPGEGGTPCNL